MVDLTALPEERFPHFRAQNPARHYARDKVEAGAWSPEEGPCRALRVYDLEVFAAFRRKGYGDRPLGAAERKAAGLGAGRVELHVFGHNAGYYRHVQAPRRALSTRRHLDSRAFAGCGKNPCEYA